jgi:hypothetical protein
MGKIMLRLARSLGLAFCWEGQAGRRRPGCPQHLPQVLVLWQQGGMSSSLSFIPNKGSCSSHQKVALLPGAQPGSAPDLLL